MTISAGINKEHKEDLVIVYVMTISAGINKEQK